MRRESSAEIAAIAGRRLEQLGRDLGRDPVVTDVADISPPEAWEGAAASPVREPGRHSRHRPPPPTERAGAWVGRRLPTLVGVVRLRTAHLTALLLIATLALAGTLWWSAHGSRTTAVPVARTSPVSTVSPQSTNAPAPLAGVAVSPIAAGSSAKPGGASTSAVVVVDVAGRVRRPGIATLPTGSRVIDALRKAGGAAPGVDLSALNLARVLTDGEQILVGRAPGATGPAGSSGGAASVSSTGSGPAGSVNLNTASVEGLEELPGVGPVTAQKILDWRTEHGAFRAIDELLEVDGIGPKTLANLAPHATL